MRHILLAASSLVLVACPQVPGTEGAPCTQSGLCATGLICGAETICVRPGSGNEGWRVVRTPVADTVNAVWGSDASNVYAVTSNGKVLQSTNGGDFVDLKHNLTTSALYVVWGWKSGTEIWAGGMTGILSLKKGVWIEERIFDPTSGKEYQGSITIRGIHGSGNAIWAVGYASSTSYVLRYNESAMVPGVDAGVRAGRWDIVPAAQLDLNFSPQGLWVAGSRIWVVGNAKHVKHFNGSAWTEQNLDKQVQLEAIWGTGTTSPAGLIAVGGTEVYLNATGSGIDSGSWTRSSTTRPGKYPLNGVWGVSLKDFVLVGEGSGFSASEFSAIERCSDTQCRSIIVPNLQKQLKAVWGAAGTYFIGGAEGLVLKSE